MKIYFWITILFISFFFNNLMAQSGINHEKNSNRFDGIYLGLNAGSQNIFGGSFVDNKDILAQGSRFVSELYGGFRKQFLGKRFMAGAEIQYGFTDGNLEHRNPDKPIYITYENNTQWGYGLTAGVVLGRRKQFLVYAYANETTRKFDVTIKDAQFTYGQTDEQGMLKYGLGFEAPVFKQIHVRASAGRLRVDFGELETNIDVEDKMDFVFGFLYQF